jgi:hypothetical protein
MVVTQRKAVGECFKRRKGKKKPVTKTNFLRIKIDEPIIVLPINYYFAHC